MHSIADRESHGHSHLPIRRLSRAAVGPSVLRMSLLGRLAIACALLAILWTAVFAFAH